MPLSSEEIHTCRVFFALPTTAVFFLAGPKIRRCWATTLGATTFLTQSVAQRLTMCKIYQQLPKAGTECNQVVLNKLIS
jgi:hypothetical protein